MNPRGLCQSFEPGLCALFLVKPRDNGSEPLPVREYCTLSSIKIRDPSEILRLAGLLVALAFPA